jgi:ATP-dependent DNA helicase RecG
MDLAELKQLVDQGESDRLEFKKTTGELKAGMQALCAMLNGSGGMVVFGVTAAGKVVGQDITDATLQEVAREIKKLEPAATIAQTMVPVAGSLRVLALEAAQAPGGPFVFDGRAYKRIGPKNSRMSQAEYQERLLARTQAIHRWENQIAEGYSPADLDSDEIDRMVRAALHCGRLASQPSDPMDVLDRLHLRVEGRLLRAAVVLFGRKFLPDYPQCALRLARFKGTSKTEFLDQRQLRGHAFQILDEAVNFIMRHIPVAGRIESGKLEREDMPLYPPLALREALVNALCHRDYTIPGGAVNVAIYDDRLEIISSGLLPPGITIADLKRSHVSRPRNPLIAEVFYRRGLIEQWGRGTQKIVDWCVAAGQPEPDFEEQAGDVVVRFLPSSYHPPLRVSHDLTDRQRQILHVLSNGERWRFRDILEQLPEPPAPRTLRDDLQFLKRAGLVDSGGRSVAARWWLKQPSRES